MMMLGSLTLLPALLGLVGTRIDNTTRGRADRRRRSPSSARSSACSPVSAGDLPRRLRAGDRRSSASASAVKPLRKLIPHRAEQPQGAAVLVPLEPLHPAPPVAGAARSASACCVLLALPLFSIRLGFGDTGNYPEDTDGRARPTTCSPRASARAPTARCSSPSRATPATDPSRSSTRSSTRSRRPRTSASAFPTADRRPSLALVIVYPDERAAGRGDDRPRQRACATTSSRRRGVDAKVGGLDRGIDRLRRLPRRTPAAAHRRRAAAQLPAADGRVPQPARAAQGGDHEPAVDRRRLRHHRRHLPVGLGHGR